MYFSYMTNIADNLKKLRKAKGMTQPQLAEELDLTQKQVSDYELAKSAPSLDMLPKIAKYFNISVDELLGAKEIAADFKPKSGQMSRHGNSRFSQLFTLFDQLSPEEQRTTLKQIRGIIADKQRRYAVAAADSKQRIFIDSPLCRRSGVCGGRTNAQVTKGVRYRTCRLPSHRPFGHLCAMLH